MIFQYKFSTVEERARKCEVGKYENDCAWVLIWKNLKEQGRLDLYTTFRLPRDNSKKTLLTKIEPR